LSISVNIPDDLYRPAREIADAQQLSVDDVIASAFAEQVAVWDRLKQRAARWSRDTFLEVLDQAPDVEPEEARPNLKVRLDDPMDSETLADNHAMKPAQVRASRQIPVSAFSGLKFRIAIGELPTTKD